ncbi:uncharacterized protein [Periplaneta americana]|uniref:uncharacterized protein n=1 Tax=Periplaneta americana TaxID=6978 RepID=UPI0037E99777
MSTVTLVTLLSCLIVASSAMTEQEILDAGYQFIKGIGYYKVHRTPATWEEGQSICRNEGAHLMIYNSPEEEEIVGVLMDSVVGRQNCFIGFHALYKDNTAVLINGKPLNTTGIEYYIDHSNNNRTGSSYGGGLVFWNPRDRELPFVCEIQLWATYDVYEGYGHYKLHTEGKTWVEAYQTCVNEGAHLAVVNSQQEARLLRNILRKHQSLSSVDDNDMVAIGFHMMYDIRDIPDEQKDYVTIFGGSIKIAGYAKWARKQPSPGLENHCGAFTRDGKLYMSKCNKKLAFICEKDM